MSLLKSTKPWFTYDAIRWLDENVKPSWKVFEWGAGDSTIYFHNKANIISIEHNSKYSENAILIPLDSDRYVKAIQEYVTFDLVCVDGRRRVDCVKEAKHHAKRILLDNSERERYQEAIECMSDWDRLDFNGKGRGGKIWMTTIWLKPE